MRSMLLIILLMSGYEPVEAQAPDAAQLFRDVQAKYASLESYSAVGEVVTSFTMDAPPTGLPAGQEVRHTFTIKLARPQMYRIEWEQKMGFASSKGAVWSDGESRFVTLAGQTMQPANTEMALAAATGVSGGAGNTIPSIFFNLSSNGIGRNATGVAIRGEERIDGDDCYVVEANMGSLKRTFWISKATKLVRQVRNDSSGGFSVPEVTDDLARQSLQAMGRTVTDEAVRALKDQMANMQKVVQGMKSSYSIETHHEIKTNEPMTPADFRDQGR